MANTTGLEQALESGNLKPLYKIPPITDSGALGQRSPFATDNKGPKNEDVTQDTHLRIEEAEKSLHQQVYIDDPAIADELFCSYFTTMGGTTEQWSKMFTTDQKDEARKMGDFELLLYRIFVVRYREDGELLAWFNRGKLRFITSWFMDLLDNIAYCLKDSDAASYMGTSWEFPLLLQRDQPKNSQQEPFPADGICTYRPRSDMRLDSNGFPVIICEIDSGAKLRDETRMLIQGMCLAKLAYKISLSRELQEVRPAQLRLTKAQIDSQAHIRAADIHSRAHTQAVKKNLVIMGVFWEGIGQARRYMLYHDGEKTYCGKAITYEICRARDIIQLMFELFNYAHYLQLMHAEQPLKKGWSRLKQDLISSQRDHPTVNAARKLAKRSHGQGPHDSGSGSGSGGAPDFPQYPGLPGQEDGDGPPNNNNKRSRDEGQGEFGYYDSSTQRCSGQRLLAFREQLEERGIALIPNHSKLPSFPHICAAQKSDGQLIVVKFLESGDEGEERSIHRKLTETLPNSPYVIPLFAEIEVVGATLLTTPLRSPLSEVDISDCAPSLMLQLLLGVSFIHNNQIAHLDLRPENLVVFEHPKGQHCLQIIDFGVAEHVGSDTELVGFRGVEEWVAPEVRSGDAFKPFPADLWACGKVLYFYDDNLMGDSGSFLRSLSGRLMSQNPLERPSLTDVGGHPSPVVAEATRQRCHVFRPLRSPSIPILSTPPQSQFPAPGPLCLERGF